MSFFTSIAAKASKFVKKNAGAIVAVGATVASGGLAAGILPAAFAAAKTVVGQKASDALSQRAAEAQQAVDRITSAAPAQVPVQQAAAFSLPSQPWVIVVAVGIAVVVWLVLRKRRD